MAKPSVVESMRQRGSEACALKRKGAPLAVYSLVTLVEEVAPEAVSVTVCAMVPGFKVLKPK